MPYWVVSGYAPLIFFKAISRDVSATQSANVHDNEDMLKLQLYFCICCPFLDFLFLNFFLFTVAIGKKSNGNSNAGLQWKVWFSTRFLSDAAVFPNCLCGQIVCARSLFVLPVTVSRSQLRAVTTSQTLTTGSVCLFKRVISWHSICVYSIQGHRCHH